MERSQPVRILLVDDTQANLVALDSVLAGPEYELIHASSGAQALRYLMSSDCALILMDVQMPDLDGYETARLIRQNARTRGIPIVFLTAYGVEDHHVQRGYASGAIDYLFKPYDPAVLRAKVAAFANLHRLQQQLVAREAQLREAQRSVHAHALAQLELRNLRRQEAGQRRYRALVDGVTHAVVWTADPVTHTPTFASPSVAAILGQEAEAWVADPTPFPERVHPADRASVRGALAALVVGQPAQRLQHRMASAAGQDRWFDTALWLQSNEDGEGLQIHGFSVDLTEPLRAREVLAFLAAAGDALARSLDCAATAEAVARLAVPELADWCVVEVPAELAGERILGVAHADGALEAAARALAARPGLAALGPCSSPRVLQGLSRALPRLDPGAAGLVDVLGPAAVLELPLRSRGRLVGVLRLFGGPAWPVPGEGERGLADELAHRAAQAIDNALLYREAREAIRLREDFLSIASHELRTPLSALTLQLRLLERFAGEGEGHLRRRVQSSLRQVDRLATLVHSLLDLARIRSGRLELQREPFDLADLVREVAARFDEPLAADGRRLEVVVSGPAPGRWDRSRLDQVLTNLLSNAAKYGGDGAIRLALLVDGEQATVAVSDQGPGIAPEELERLFGRFVQGAGASGKGGLGLGLFIARSIVEAHGGRISAESRPGHGTTFTLELPAEAGAERAAGPTPAAAPDRPLDEAEGSATLQ
ncbi:MAG: ATP-binding protein [Anaeromyxobacter sp.]